MVAHLENEPDAKAVVNFAPILLEQSGSRYFCESLFWAGMPKTSFRKNSDSPILSGFLVQPRKAVGHLKVR
jgi:hypothetical protein